MIDRSGVTAVFRTEWPRLVATLVRDLGDLDLAEDAAQEAFVEAADRWERDGLPDRPGAWLVTTARRKAIDSIRRSQRFDGLRPELEARAGRAHHVGEHDPGDHELVDDQLALLLGCCHPALAPDAQVALTLRAVAGLSTRQIAGAFFVSEETMTRRLTRAKAKIRGANIPFRTGGRDLLRERLPVVCGVIYSIFTEGHTSSGAPTLVRGGLCDEAIWLGTLLTDLVPDDPEVGGLVALMLLTDARRTTRIDDRGLPVLLADQDRERWDRDGISRGLATLGAAHAHGVAGPYQLQAAIAALHVTAPTFDATDWPRIVHLYDVLVARWPSAVLALNRAVALSYARGPAAGLAALDAIRGDQAAVLAAYPYLHSARAELLARVGRTGEAVDAFVEAERHARNDAERAFLHERRRVVSGPGPQGDRVGVAHGGGGGEDPIVTRTVAAGFGRGVPSPHER